MLLRSVNSLAKHLDIFATSGIAVHVFPFGKFSPFILVLLVFTVIYRALNSLWFCFLKHL